MYRKSDVEIVEKNLNNILEEVSTRRLKLLEPTFNEFKSVQSDVLNYIRKNRKLVYGGFAQNKLIEKKNRKDVFYSDNDLYDVEFYSYEPEKDIISLCDMLNKKGYKYVQCVEGIHNETFKINVNFENYCDISYLPKNIYDSIPKIEYDGYICIHPHYMMIDMYRVFTDPLISYFRLEKTFTRFNKLVESYPFDLNIPYKINDMENNKHNYSDIIYKNIIMSSKLIIIGYYSFINLVNNSVNVNKSMTYQLISIDYEKDKKEIFNKLKKIYKNITSSEFYPFGVNLCYHTEYYVDKVCILKLYGNYNRCIVYRIVDNVYYGTFQLTFMHLLIDHFYSLSYTYDYIYNNMISYLLKYRNEYLEKNYINILSNSVFKEFTIDCIGNTSEPTRDKKINDNNNNDVLYKSDKKIYKKSIKLKIQEKSGKKI
jgi:hypothetical protein